MLRWLDFKNIFIWFGFSRFFAMLCFFLFFFLLRDGILLDGACARHVALHVPYACAHWSFQNSGRCRCTPRGMVVEVWFPPPGPSDGREKIKQRKSWMKKQGIGFWEKIQRDITLDILNEIMRFKRKFVLLSTSKKIGGGVLIYHYNIILNFYLDS